MEFGSSESSEELATAGSRENPVEFVHCQCRYTMFVSFVALKHNIQSDALCKSPAFSL